MDFLFQVDVDQIFIERRARTLFLFYGVFHPRIILLFDFCYHFCGRWPFSPILSLKFLAGSKAVLVAISNGVYDCTITTFSFNINRVFLSSNFLHGFFALDPMWYSLFKNYLHCILFHPSLSFLILFIEIFYF